MIVIHRSCQVLTTHRWEVCQTVHVFILAC